MIILEKLDAFRFGNIVGFISLGYTSIDILIIILI